MSSETVQVAVPTASLVVLRSAPETVGRIPDIMGSAATRRLLLDSTIYVVRFRTKHDGGVGIPGERVQFQHEKPIDAALRAGAEELGLTADRGLALTREQLFPFTCRVGPTRDYRGNKPFPLVNYAHGPENVPETLAALGGAPFRANHCFDTLFCALGVDVEPETLVPGDAEEVSRIECLDLSGDIPHLAISDDELLCHALREWINGTLSERPPLLEV